MIRATWYLVRLAGALALGTVALSILYRLVGGG